MCTAHCKDGRPCGQRAIAGHHVCYYHGGANPSTRRIADQNIAAMRAKHLLQKEFSDGFPPIDDPMQAIMDLAAEAWASKELFREKIEEIRYQSKLGEQLRAEVALYERAMDRCLKIFETITRLGIAERRTRIQEAQAVMILGMLQRIGDHLDLSDSQREVWAEVVPTELRALETAVGGS